jgi:site-specific DNA recombinase
MNQQKRVVEVLRVSTNVQDNQRQKADIERVKAAHSLVGDRTVELDGVSGRKVLANRDMQRVLADLRLPHIAGVAISALDRLFRMERYSDFGILDNFIDTGKMIFSAKEGPLDLATDAGLIISLMSGATGALEWRELRRRTVGGKELLRKLGGCADGRPTLPRGVGFEPVKDAKGRSVGARWFYVEPDASRIRLAYDLLFERRSWHDIAERIGGGFTYNGVKTSLKNTVWKAVRTYAAGRETPLEVPMAIEPLISPERWAKAQEIILEKRDRWSKTKKPAYFLLSGLLRCSCGAPCYVRCNSNRRSYYICSTHHRGNACGAKSVQQKATDRLAEQIVSKDFLDPGFLKKVIGRFKSAQPERDHNAEKITAQREQLEAERQRLLRMTLKGTITEDDFSRESKRIESEMRDLDRLAPAPVPAAFDPAKLVVQITRSFARFAKQSFEEKRDFLRTAFKEITLDNGALTGMTLNGAFLDSVNSSPRCSPSSTP